MNKTAVEWLASNLEITWEEKIIDLVEQAKAIEKDQLGALYLTLLLNTPDITQFDFEEWYKQNTSNEQGK
jgi:hypothetical protein